MSAARPVNVADMIAWLRAHPDESFFSLWSRDRLLIGTRSDTGEICAWDCNVQESKMEYDRRASPAPETRTADTCSGCVKSIGGPRFCLSCLERVDVTIGAPETRTAAEAFVLADTSGPGVLAWDRQPAPETRTGEGAETPIVRSDWRCEAGTEACPGTQGSLAKEWICVACGRKAHAPKTWRDKGLAAKPPTYEPSGSEKDGEGPRSPSPREGTP